MIMMHHLPSYAFSHVATNQAVFCGCGESFANHCAFKEHSLLDHQGQHIDGSSHFLSKFTLVVLPATTRRTKVYHQDWLLQNFSGEDDSDVHSKRKAKEQQESVFEPRHEYTEAKRPSSNFGLVGLQKLVLIRNDQSWCKYSYYCGSCRQRDFSNATEFIMHLRDICPVVHKRSTHFLTFLDYDQEVQEYINETHKPKQRANGSILRTFLNKILGTNVDHYDLPFFCWACRQKFPRTIAFWEHIARIHQEQIPQGSSHVFLRFRDRFSMCLTEKIDWIHDEETALCPCNPGKKMTVANLIKHLRQMHHGVSPFYERELMDEVIAQKNNEKGRSVDKSNKESVIEHNQPKATTKSQHLQEDIEYLKQDKIQIIHPKLSDQIKKEAKSLRLVRVPNTSYSYLYCGSCQRKDFKDSEQFILHLIDICQDKHPKSSHFLAQTNFKKEIDDYIHTNHHKSISMKWSTKAQENLLLALNITIDHSDLSFECGVCRQLFDSHSYYTHVLSKHSEIIDPKSSHIVLRVPWNNQQKRKPIYITDRVPWVNNEKIYFCPCKPQMKVTMESLIKHVREVHMGISPLYDRSNLPAANNLCSNTQHQTVPTIVLQNHSPQRRKLKIQQKQQDWHIEGTNPYSDLPVDAIDKSANLTQEAQSIKMKNHPTLKNITYFKKKNELLMQVIGTYIDHKDLPFECGDCRRIFQTGNAFYTHANLSHSETIDPLSSHIILRFFSEELNKAFCFYLSDRVPWINSDEIYYCPCKTDKKITMSSLIKHVREVHMGISPIYRKKANHQVQDIIHNAPNQDLGISNTEVMHNAVQQKIQDDEVFSEDYKKEEKRPEQNFLPLHQDAEKDELANIRLIMNSQFCYKNSAHYYCGVCRRNNINNPTDFITHIKNSCSDNHPKSSHFLVSKDFEKEVKEYQMKKDHISATVKYDGKRYVDFITGVLGNTYDHSDLTFECYPCRQIFKEGRSYNSHAFFRHQRTIHSKSSHIILCSFTGKINQRKNIYISDRVPWVNNDERYYCPCKPEKIITMESLIQHVREIHKGISPPYEM